MHETQLATIAKCYLPYSDKSLLRKKSGSGGAKEDRTPDLLLARQALSQLSYGPKRNPKK